MSYVMDLVRLPAGVDPESAYRQRSKHTEQTLADGRGPDPGPVDREKEEAKKQLARVLVARHPSLHAFQPDFTELARWHRIEVAEARRRFRHIELNDERRSIQITLFDDAAGVSFAFSGTFADCDDAIRMLWDCLEVLHTHGGFSAFDPQIGKVLNLESDFDRVLNAACGRRP
jgi:hypothetical protein